MENFSLLGLFKGKLSLCIFQRSLSANSKSQYLRRQILSLFVACNSRIDKKLLESSFCFTLVIPLFCHFGKKRGQLSILINELSHKHRFKK